MSLWISLEYGSTESRYNLPDELLLASLPPEGMTIALRHQEEDGSLIDFEVEVEEVFIDATAPRWVRYKAFVIVA